MITLGLVLALMSGLFRASKDILTKQATNDSDAFATSFGVRAATALILSVTLFATTYTLPSAPEFWAALAINTILYTGLTVAVTRAFEVTDLSIISPVLAITPVPITIASVFILGEIPSPIAGIGIVLIAIGAYILNVDDETESLLDPVYKLSGNPAMKYVLITLAFVSVIPSIDKIGIMYSSPVQWVFLVHVAVSIPLLGLFWWKSDNWTRQVGDNWKVFLALGVSNGLLWVFQAEAYTMAKVGYVQSLKNISILATVVAGQYFFGEDQFRERISGAAIILVGVVLILLTA